MTDISISVQTWTAVEVRALRGASRLTVESFAAKLGVAPRTINNWESGFSAPRDINQANLDTFLHRHTDERSRSRFLSETGLAYTSLPLNEDSTPPDPILPEDSYVRHPRDGKLMAYVPEGVYLSGPGGDSPLWLPSFYIDVYPVTNADYLRFLTATDYPAPAEWQTSDSPGADVSNHPVVFVTWIDANSYAEWAHKSLPTSQQWEKTARGVRGAVYPWGSARTAAKCNTRENAIGSTTPVDRFQSGAGPYGTYDMCGNVWEWCLTTSEPGRRELKGGAFTSPFRRAEPHGFNDADSTMRDDDTGFRCVAHSLP